MPDDVELALFAPNDPPLAETRLDVDADGLWVGEPVLLLPPPVAACFKLFARLDALLCLLSEPEPEPAPDPPVAATPFELDEPDAPATLLLLLSLLPLLLLRSLLERSCPHQTRARNESQQVAVSDACCSIRLYHLRCPCGGSSS